MLVTKTITYDNSLELATSRAGWVGVSWDACRINGVTNEHIVCRILKHLGEGIDIKIILPVVFHDQTIALVKNWCTYFIGRQLEITNVIDSHMLLLYGSRVCSVSSSGHILEQNTDAIAAEVYSAPVKPIQDKKRK